jgi:hypothetical protein
MKTYLVNRKTLCWEISTVEIKANSQEEAVELVTSGEGSSESDEFDYDVGDDLNARAKISLVEGYQDNLYPTLVFKGSQFYSLLSQNDLIPAANFFGENFYSFAIDFGKRSSNYLFIDPPKLPF